MAVPLVITARLIKRDAHWESRAIEIRIVMIVAEKTGR
jgi:hypothetical protein